MIVNSENKSMDMEVRDINYILPAYVKSYLFISRNEMPKKITFPMFPSVKVNGIDIPIEYVPPLDEIALKISKDGKDVAEVTPAQEAALDEKDEEIKRLRNELTQTGLGGEQEEEITPEQLEDEAAGKKLEEDTEVVPAPEDLIRQEQETADEVTEGLTEEEQTYEAAKADQPKASPAKAAFTIDPNPSHQPPPGRQPKQPPGGDLGPGAGPSDMQSRQRGDQTRTARDLIDEPEISEAEEAGEKEFEKPVSRDEKGNPVVEDKA